MHPPIRPRLSNIKLAIWYFTLTVMHHTYQRHMHSAALEGTITWAHYQPTQKICKPPATRKWTNPHEMKNPQTRDGVHGRRRSRGTVPKWANIGTPMHHTPWNRFTQPSAPIKKYNSTAKGIVTATVRQKRSKEMHMRFYWIKDEVKQKDFLFIIKQEAKTWGTISRNITHHSTIRKFLLRICIRNIP